MPLQPSSRLVRRRSPRLRRVPSQLLPAPMTGLTPSLHPPRRLLLVLLQRVAVVWVAEVLVAASVVIAVAVAVLRKPVGEGAVAVGAVAVAGEVVTVSSQQLK